MLRPPTPARSALDFDPSRRRALKFGLVLLGGGSAGLLAACSAATPTPAPAPTAPAPTAPAAAPAKPTGAPTAAPAAAAPTVASPKPLTKVNVQLAWVKDVEFAGSYVADNKGYYKAEGLDVTLTSGGSSVDALLPVINGNALIASGRNAEGVADARAKGAPIKIIGVVLQKNPFAMLSLKKNGIATPQDLLGKKVGVAASDEAVYQTFLKLTKLDASKISKVPVQFDPAPLANGEVDAFVSFVAEQPVELQTKGIDVSYFLFADYGYTAFAGTYVATEDSIKNKRDQLLSFMRAEVKGWQDNIADPTLAAHLTVDTYGQALGLDYESQLLGNQIYAEKLIQTPVTQANGLLWMGDDDIKSNLALFQSNGSQVTADLFTNEILKEVYNGKNKL